MQFGIMAITPFPLCSLAGGFPTPVQFPLTLGILATGQQPDSGIDFHTTPTIEHCIAGLASQVHLPTDHSSNDLAAQVDLQIETSLLCRLQGRPFPMQLHQ